MAIDSRQQRFGRSNPMIAIEQPYSSLQEIELQRWGHALESSQRALCQSMNSPAYQQFRNNTAPVWNTDHQDLHGSFNGTMRGGGDGSAVQSPSSDTTVKLGNSHHGHNGSHTRSPVPHVALTTPEIHNAQNPRTSRPEIPLSLRSHSLAGTLADSPRRPHFGDPNQTQAMQAMYALPPGWTPPAQMQTHRSQEPLRFVSNPNAATYDGHAFLSPAPCSPLGSPKDLHVPRRTNLHQRRLSGRMSSLPSIPSPLGPGRMREQLHSGDSGVLLSSVPNGLLRQDQKIEYGKQGDVKRKRNPAPHSPTVQRYASSGSIDSPAFDVYPRSAQIDNERNISLPPPGFTNGSGHSRKHTDPFVDPEPIQHSSAYVNYTRICGPSTPFQLPSQLSMRPPRTPLTAEWPTSAPATFGFARQPTPAFPPSKSRPASRGRLPTRSNLPIPPPPLSSIHGQYKHTPQAHAILEAQKPVREEWIRTEATRIAQLARVRHAAERRYGETHAEQDYKNWQKIEVAYADATNLEKRQGERRNLFLNAKGMKALKTNKAEDMSAASREQGDGDREEKLLGFKMALMERECAEVKRDEDEAITVEMLATLGLEEKRALRKHLVGRLERS